MGIPIELPGWTQFLGWTIAILLALAVGALIWNTLVRSKGNTLDGETRAKVDIILLILRGWQKQYEIDFPNGPVAKPENIGNEHYAPEPQPESEPTQQYPHYEYSVAYQQPHGSRVLPPNETTTPHGKPLVQ
jgi:hypothetical protein